MAYDLKAKLELIDRFTSPMRKALSEAKSFERTAQSVGSRTREMSSSFDRAASSISRMGSMARSAKGGLSDMGNGIKSVTTGLVGLAGAYITLQGAQKAFDMTVGAAARTEFEQKAITALFNDTTKAKNWFDYIEQRAKDSSLFSMDDFLKTSRSYIPLTKDLKQLEKMTALTERLAASNPTQGMEGAAFAIREALSGDMVSLVDRFNIPRAMAAQLKGKSGAEFNQALDQMLNKLGYTDKYLEDISNTGIAKYNQAMEKMRFLFRDMGTKGLEEAKGALDEINKMFESGAFGGIQQVGSDLITSAMGSLKTGLQSLNAYMLELKNDPTWNSLGTSDKLIRILDDGVNAAVAWFNGPGGDKFLETAGKAAAVGGKIGVALAGGVVQGVGDSLAQNPIGNVLLGVVAALATPGGPIIKAAVGVGVAIGSAIAGQVNKWLDKIYAERDAKRQAEIEYARNGNNTPGQTLNPGNMPSTPHYNGLETVPYDGYRATLHRGETVLTRQEADARRNGSGGITVSIGNITLGSGSTREQADEIVNYIVGGLREAVANG